MPNAYYTLLIRDSKDSPWRVEFGAYVKAEVEAEMYYYREDGIKKSDMKIIRSTTDSQKQIEHAVTDLNARGLLNA